LRVETPEARRAKSITTVDLKGTCIDRSWRSGRACSEEKGRKRKTDLQTVDQEASPEITRSTVSLIVGTESAWTLKILERAAIETTVLPKGYVAIGSELRGEKRCGLKPLLATPQSRAYVRS
jgi:hypothetical protein